MGMIERIKGRRAWVMGFILLGIVSVLGGWENRSWGQGVPVGKRIPVKVVIAKKAGPSPVIAAMGTIDTITKAEVGSEIFGVLKSVPVEEGDDVKEGQVIAILDTSLAEADLKQSQAALELAQVQLKQMDHEIAKARAKVEKARITAEKTERFLNDQKRLFDIGGVTLTTVDEAEIRYREAVADYETAKEELNVLETESDGGKRDGELRIKKAEADVESAKIKIGKSTIRAPLSGRVTKKDLFTSEVARDGHQTILTLSDLDEVFANVDVNEKDMSRIKTGLPAQVVADAFPEKPFTGKVARMGPTVNKDNRTFVAKIRVKNRGYVLKPGMFVRAEIYSSAKAAGLVIPRECVRRGKDGKSHVFVVVDEVALLTEVQVGSSIGDLAEIVKGLKEGDKVVIEGQESLVDLAGVQSTLLEEGWRQP
jgi:multidrug efflux pump subunit AcrA (membrane-fusion protein)